MPARWSRDGREIFYTTDFTTGADSMMAAELTGGANLAIKRRYGVFFTRPFYSGSGTLWDVLPGSEGFVMVEIGSAGTSTRHLVMLEQWKSLLLTKQTARD